MDQLITVTESASAELIGKIDDLNARAWEVHITDPKLGLELSMEAKRLAEENNYKKGLAYAIRNMGVSHRYLSNLENALSLSFQALDIFVQMEDKNGEAQAYVSIGAIYYYMGDFDRSLDYFLKGIKHNEEVGNKQALSYAFNGAGYIYGVLGDNKKGLEFLLKALALSKEAGVSYDLLASILDSIAVVYVNDGQLDKAYDTYLECLRLGEESSGKVNLGYALIGIGDLFEKQNRFDEAKEYYLRSLTVRKEIGYKVGEATSLLHLGKLLLKQNNSDQAKEYLTEALKVAEDIKAKAVIYEAHEALAELFEKKEDIQLFAKHYKLYSKYKSEVFKEEQESKQKYLTIQFEMEKLQQEAEINRLTNVVMKEKNDELEKKTEELEQSYNSISLLSKIGRDITSTLNLDTILNTVYTNVNEMMDATVFGIGIFNQDENCIEYRMSIEKGKRYQPYRRTMENKNQFPVWCIENKKEVFINDIQNEYSKYLTDIDMTLLSSVEMEDGSLPEKPHSLIYLPLMVKDTVIGLISVQSYQKNAYTAYHLNILKTLASYTSAALYNAQSYLTLQNTLNELKLTQEQLVQSEKMASLGELTAGIAHEIQNPLNFVNNFSEVNKELLVEMKDEIAKGNLETVKEIATDVINNEEKINHHGKRADTIVKGMLQHSRSIKGTKEPTDINALADEYLRLAYHGLKAKDKSFNATLKTVFDKGIGNINIIPQDLGRVILNLINNAFYAVNEKKKAYQPHSTGVAVAYEPTVIVSTKKAGDKVEISVKDNGNGIPQKVLDKIFQPFFTTKPTGQGTGLGLSLSYDIIKAHGGELKVETKEGEGSVFSIVLPVT
jgi:signal transduction histidine kinase